MAEEQPDQGVVLDHSQFCCSVCLDLLKEPVTIPCGHSYCRGCIEGYWDQGDEKVEVSCPQCRESFSSRPVLRRNNMLAEVVEKLKRTQQASPSDPLACAGPGDVACDFCCGPRRNKATMSCLTCLASYCPAHLEPHHAVPVLKVHQLVSTTIPLQDKMCTKHNKLMEVYCRNEGRCICYLCTLDEHSEHNMVSAAAERKSEQKKLAICQTDIRERVQEREKELNELVGALKDFKSDSQTAVKSSEIIFDELISSLKTKRSMMKQQIEDQEKTAVAKAEELQLQLEEEIAKLKRRDMELEELSHTDDHIHFIQTFQSLSTSCESPDLPPNAVVLPQLSVKTVTDCVSEMRDDIEDLLTGTWTRISTTVSSLDVVLPPVPKTREEFLRYRCSPTLDRNSVNTYFSLSKENRQVTYSSCGTSYVAHSGRFKNVRQVLCEQGLSDRCYWEVSFSGCTWSVAVSYKSIGRSSEFGKNDESWSLQCSPTDYDFWHDSEVTTVSGPQSSTIGVYVDHRAGTLSFYSVSDTMTLLHNEHTTFTQPLYPGLGFKKGGSFVDSKYYAEMMKL
ncbi:E3 ubiquitin-protein ligase TRIM16-like [Mugil cephalus]|uniref:E3 ubiquitin-protein ligase TRIM16-like n=1 Tax=Mugil cephalus TaxID=48193 RepID=UPI001FB6FBC8|nr:E3 ubiquitin-protein ligase TRIM16-like [Mugil cephalus]